MRVSVKTSNYFVSYNLTPILYEVLIAQNFPLKSLRMIASSYFTHQKTNCIKNNFFSQL